MTELLTARSGRIKAARRLADRRVRREVGRFLVEGPQLIEEAYGVPDAVVEVYATPEAAQRYADLRDRSPAEWQLTEDRGVEALSDTVTATGVVAVCRSDRVLTPLAEAVDASARLVVVCADVRDPGNAGTVIRSADAAGADAVVLVGRSVDPLNPKTVRATVGSLFHLPVSVAGDIGETLALLRERGQTILAADGAGEVDLFDADELLAGPTAWLLGNEAWGLPAEVAAVADHRVRVPIFGAAESLNLSTAAAVCLYASARAQRR